MNIFYDGDEYSAPFSPVFSPIDNYGWTPEDDIEERLIDGDHDSNPEAEDNQLARPHTNETSPTNDPLAVTNRPNSQENDYYLGDSDLLNEFDVNYETHQATDNSIDQNTTCNQHQTTNDSGAEKTLASDPDSTINEYTEMHQVHDEVTYLIPNDGQKISRAELFVSNILGIDHNSIIEADIDQIILYFRCQSSIKISPREICDKEHKLYQIEAHYEEIVKIFLNHPIQKAYLQSISDLETNIPSNFPNRVSQLRQRSSLVNSGVNILNLIIFHDPAVPNNVAKNRLEFILNPWNDNWVHELIKKLKAIPRTGMKVFPTRMHALVFQFTGIDPIFLVASDCFIIAEKLNQFSGFLINVADFKEQFKEPIMVELGRYFDQILNAFVNVEFNKIIITSIFFREKYLNKVKVYKINGLIARYQIISPDYPNIPKCDEELETLDKSKQFFHLKLGLCPESIEINDCRIILCHVKELSKDHLMPWYDKYFMDNDIESILVKFGLFLETIKNAFLNIDLLLKIIDDLVASATKNSQDNERKIESLRERNKILTDISNHYLQCPRDIEPILEAEAINNELNQDSDEVLDQFEESMEFSFNNSPQDQGGELMQFSIFDFAQESEEETTDEPGPRNNRWQLHYYNQSTNDIGYKSRL